MVIRPLDVPTNIGEAYPNSAKRLKNHFVTEATAGNDDSFKVLRNMFYM